MTRHRATVDPVPRGPRPRWSVMIPSWNSAGYLRRSLKSVLDQDPGPETMQIEVVDDFSTEEDPAAVVEELGQGRVGFHRQPRNVGHVANFNTCLQRSRGHLIHVLHADDLVLPGFYATLQKAFESHQEIGAAFCRDRRIDHDGKPISEAEPLRSESGILEDWLETIAQGQRLQAPAMVVRREVYEQIGGFDDRISCYGEDWEMWVRIAARFPVWYEREALAAYRIHMSSLTARGIRTGAHAADYRRVIMINQEHLPSHEVRRWSRKASVNFSRACMRRGWRAVVAGQLRGGAAHFREGIRTSVSPRVALEFAIHGVRAMGKIARRTMTRSSRRNARDTGLRR